MGCTESLPSVDTFDTVEGACQWSATTWGKEVAPEALAELAELAKLVPVCVLILA